jgi:hypothetical protein
MIFEIIIHENWTSSSFVMRKKRKKVWQTREIRPPPRSE